MTDDLRDWCRCGDHLDSHPDGGQCTVIQCACCQFEQAQGWAYKRADAGIVSILSQPIRLHGIPIDWQEAVEFTRKHHRHHRPPVGALFHVAAGTDHVCGVAIVGRPVARHMDDGWTAEVTRLTSDGCENVCSYLYRAAWRIAVTKGYVRLITYTLASETGASLRGAGFRMVGEVKGRSWSCKSRPRVDKHPTQDKLRWEITK